MSIKGHINLALNRRRARKAAAIIRRMDRTMVKIGMSRQARRSYWQNFARSEAMRDAVLSRMEK